MRSLPFALLLLPTLALADVSSPTDATPTDSDMGSACEAEGDACTTDDGQAGICDADLMCMASDDGGGCDTVGAPVAGGVTLLSIGLLAVRRTRRPKACCAAD